MKTIVIIFIVGFAVLHEVLGLKKSLDALFYKGELDKELVEPDEEITLYQSVVNQSWMPMLYINLMTALHEDAECLENEQWCKQHLYHSAMETFCKYRMYLLGHRKWKDKVHFCMKKRGCYHFGHYYIEAGDIFGLKSEVRSADENHELVVMPATTDSEAVWKAYSGFIGDISAQRFILEDPVLTVGFREYTGHEPMKSISFNQTAKMGKMYVKCYDYTTELKVTILLNMYDGTAEELEHCLEIVRTVCQDLETRHISYAFASNGDVAEYIAPGLGDNHFNVLMKQMGKSNLNSYYSLESLLIRCEDKRYQSRGFILVTPPLDEKNQALVQRFNQKLDSEMCILTGGERE